MRKLFPAAIIFLAAAIAFFVILPKASIDLSHADQHAPVHNYVLFVDRLGRAHARIPEINGELLLEALLAENLGARGAFFPQGFLHAFDDGGIFGMWPVEAMRKGKAYFQGKPPVRLFPDADDTAWGRRLAKKPWTDEAIYLFLTDQKLSGVFQDASQAAGCDTRYLVQVWGSPAWHDDMDIVVSANMISSFDLSSPLQEKVFAENKKLINHVILNGHPERFMRYYEPKVTGIFLLLYYDRTGRPFLSEESKKVLLAKLKEHFSDLEKPACSRYGGGDEFFYGYNLAYLNDHIPPLMAQYARRYLLKNTR